MRVSRRIENFLCAKGATAALIQALFVTSTAKIIGGGDTWMRDFLGAIRPLGHVADRSFG